MTKGFCVTRLGWLVLIRELREQDFIIGKIFDIKWRHGLSTCLTRFFWTKILTGVFKIVGLKEDQVSKWKISFCWRKCVWAVWRAQKYFTQVFAKSIVWKLEHFSPTIFSIKFVKLTFLLKSEEVFSKLISRKFFEVGVNFRHYHTVKREAANRNRMKIKYTIKSRAPFV